MSSCQMRVSYMNCMFSYQSLSKPTSNENLFQSLLFVKFYLQYSNLFSDRLAIRQRGRHRTARLRDVHPIHCLSWLDPAVMLVAPHDQVQKVGQACLGDEVLAAAFRTVLVQHKQVEPEPVIWHLVKGYLVMIFVRQVGQKRICFL